MPDDRLARMGETRAEYFDRKDSNKALAFERKFVRALFDKLGTPSWKEKIKRAEDTKTDDGYDTFMTIAWVHREYPDCPVRFSAFGHVFVNVGLGEFRPRKLRGSWDEAVELLAGAGQYVACAFPSTVGAGVLVLHDLSMLPKLDDWERIEFNSMSLEGSTKSLSLESVEVFASRLRELWIPE